MMAVRAKPMYSKANDSLLTDVTVSVLLRSAIFFFLLLLLRKHIAQYIQTHHTVFILYIFYLYSIMKRKDISLAQVSSIIHLALALFVCSSVRGSFADAPSRLSRL
jgi:hypothetical protein